LGISQKCNSLQRCQSISHLRKRWFESTAKHCRNNLVSLKVSNRHYFHNISADQVYELYEEIGSHKTSVATLSEKCKDLQIQLHAVTSEKTALELSCEELKQQYSQSQGTSCALPLSLLQQILDIRLNTSRISNFSSIRLQHIFNNNKQPTKPPNKSIFKFWKELKQRKVTYRKLISNSHFLETQCTGLNQRILALAEENRNCKSRKSFLRSYVDSTRKRRNI